MESLSLGDRVVGDGGPAYVIAEVGANHNGDMELCRRLIDAAAEAGADAVKFQSWSKSTLISKAEYARNTRYDDAKKHFGSLEAMVEKYQLTPEQHRLTADYCKERGVAFLSSPFSTGEVDLLDELDVPAFKIASMDVNHLPLLEHVGSKQRPVFLSTGMSTIGEIERALDTLRRSGSGPVALLHCIAIYPPDFKDNNLRNIAMLRQAFDVPVGFSDHTMGISIPLAAIALGACVIEKHFTLDKGMEGWDHAISADVPELKAIVREGRNVLASLGTTVRTVSPAEMDKRKKFRRRIVLKRAMKRGELLSIGDLDFKRPGTGIHPDELAYVAGRNLVRDVEADGELEWEDLA